jgi:hypothetical protein
MEIELRHIDLNGRRIPITGKYRQEGEGNTVATVASVVLVAPVVGFFINGHSAIIPAGRQLTARTRDILPVVLPVGASTQVSAVQATLASTPAVAPASPSAVASAPANHN